ncbi:MAG TPA: MarR family transcriptional regulator [Puia sp.]|jgi:DNA-binding MarR family transcriptional regulator|nr:MarR family transcriptional regulator [Puia sp.]
MVKSKTVGNSVGPSDIEIAGNLRAVIHRLVKVLRKHTRNEEMLSLTERSTLGLLYQHGQLLPTELAQIEKVTTQSMSQVISYLVEIAYILKTPAATDKRKVYLSLTPAGRDYIERHRQEKQEWLARTLHEKTSPREKEVLSEALTILSKLIDE